ncbi:hypothetical protein [Fischerella sp. PCC 9605]|nr:hypothetical protein [Fischerella sp. PCC 9605]
MLSKDGCFEWVDDQPFVAENPVRWSQDRENPANQAKQYCDRL